jgi:hypothetical protein
VDDGRDSAQLLDKFLAKYGALLPCIVVKNQGCGKDFSELEALPSLAEAEFQVIQASLPALYADTMRKIDKLNFSFWAATNVKDGSAQHLGLMERQRAKVWLKKTYAMLDGIFARLGADK